MLVYLKSFLLISMIELDHQRSAEHVSGAERWEFPLPAHVGVRSPRSTTQSHTRPLRSFPLPAHLQFHPAPVKSLHARSNLKFLCMPNTCRFQTEALRLGHTACVVDVERVCCVTAEEQIHFTYILSRGRGCGVVGLHLIRTYSAGSVAALIC